MSKEFLRRDSNRYSKLGKLRKKKQKWRRPTGRDNKMRERRKGYPKLVSVGYRKADEERNKIRNKEPILINNLKELEKVKKEQIVLIGKMGRKKKKEIAEKIKEMKLEVGNLNVKKFLKTFEKKEKKKNSVEKEEKKKESVEKKEESNEKKKESTEENKTTKGNKTVKGDKKDESK